MGITMKSTLICVIALFLILGSASAAKPHSNKNLKASVREKMMVRKLSTVLTEAKVTKAADADDSSYSFCAACDVFVDVVEFYDEIFGNDSVVAIEDYLNDLCVNVSFLYQSLCYELVDAYGLPIVDDILNGTSGTAACAYYGLCPSGDDDTPTTTAAETTTAAGTTTADTTSTTSAEKPKPTIKPFAVNGLLKNKVKVQKMKLDVSKHLDIEGMRETVKSHINKGFDAKKSVEAMKMKAAEKKE